MLSVRLRLSFCGCRVRRPGMRFEPYFLCVVTPFCIYTCLLIRLGLRFCIYKWLLIRWELRRCIYTVAYAPPVCDPSTLLFMRGGPPFVYSPVC
jgi:hypothetical protein